MTPEIEQKVQALIDQAIAGHRHEGFRSPRVNFFDLFNVGDNRVLFDHIASVGNSTTNETDLYSDNIQANVLIANGDKLEAQYAGTFVSSATATRRVRIYFAGNTLLDTGALTLSLSAAWTVYVTIMRVSETVVRYMVSLATEGAALAAYTSSGEVTGLTLKQINILKVTGTAAGTGAATNDIVALLGYVEKKSLAQTIF